MTASDDTDAVKVHVDGADETFNVRGDETLLDTLREHLGTSGVRYCCGIGVCGTCTVLLDGAPASSCLLLTTMVEDRDVITPRGLAASSPTGLTTAQQAFANAGAYQCSYCIPAMALTVHGVLATTPDANADDLYRELGGNLCRCGSYPQIRAAIEVLLADHRSGETSAEGKLQ